MFIALAVAIFSRAFCLRSSFCPVLFVIAPPRFGFPPGRFASGGRRVLGTAAAYFSFLDLFFRESRTYYRCFSLRLDLWGDGGLSGFAFPARRNKTYEIRGIMYGWL